MRKKTVQFAALMLLIILLIPQTFAATDPTLDQKLIRVGLRFGSSSMVSANLENAEDCGSGYRLGYFDDELNFVELGLTEETTISMLKTHNIYLKGSGEYDTIDQGKGAVGCYHVQLPGEYEDFESASLAAQEAGGFVAWIDGVYYVRYSSYTSYANAAAAAAEFTDATVGETSMYGISVVKTGTAQILFQFDDLDKRSGLGVMPDITEDDDPQTWFKGYKYRGGFRYQRRSGGDLTVVNVVDLGNYVKGVTPYEMSPSWPLEALKAQAVCARTYALSNLNKHRSHGFDICQSTECQVYYGTNRENSTTIASVEETAGVTVKYQGNYADTVFSSSDGGATENSENVWNHPYPYLRGVADPYEAAVEDMIPNYRWTSTWSAKDLRSKLISKGFTNCGEIVSVSIKKTEMGNVYSMTFTDSNGKNWTVYKESCRTYFAFRSQRFDLASSGTESQSILVNGQRVGSLEGLYAINGAGEKTPLSGIPYIITPSGVTQLNPNSSSVSGSTFTFSGSGYGHNVGMSQWGAYAMAQQGHDFEDILTFYYTGVTVE